MFARLILDCKIWIELVFGCDQDLAERFRLVDIDVLVMPQLGQKLETECGILFLSLIIGLRPLNVCVPSRTCLIMMCRQGSIFPNPAVAMSWSCLSKSLRCWPCGLNALASSVMTSVSLMSVSVPVPFGYSLARDRISSLRCRFFSHHRLPCGSLSMASTRFFLRGCVSG